MLRACAGYTAAALGEISQALRLYVQAVVGCRHYGCGAPAQASVPILQGWLLAQQHNDTLVLLGAGCVIILSNTLALHFEQ